MGSHVPARPLTLSFASLRVIATFLVLGVGGAACGSDGGTGSPTGGSGMSVPSGTSDSVIDLREAARVLTAYGGHEGDFRSDQPGLTTGDFNSDGFADILLGARFADGPGGSRTDAGEAYIIYGSEQPDERVDLGEGQANVTIIAAAAGDNLGIQVAAADVNGDGVDDALIGASLALRPLYPNNKTGAVYVIFGRETLEGVVDLAASQQDVMIIGPRNLSHFGDSVAGGDVNGDGIHDIIVGAPFAEEIIGTGSDAVYNTGAVYVVYGSHRLPKQIDLENGQPDAFLVGAGENDEMGDEVAAGDLNADGFDDIISVAEAADGPGDTRDGAGEVYVFYGSPTFGGVKRTANADQDVTLLGAEGGDTLGFSAHVADLSGDGVDDLILGARLASGPDNLRPSAGEAYVIFGGRLPETLDLAEGPPNVTVHGARPGDFLGTSIATGDLNGDGFPELIISADFASGGLADRLHAGAAYVFSRIADGDVLDVANDDERYLLLGANAGDQAGSVATGDLDGDGEAELIIVAPGASIRGDAAPVGQAIAIRVR